MRRAALQLAVACLFVPIWSVQAGCSSIPRLKVIESRAQSGLTGPETRFLVISDREGFSELHDNIHAVRRPAPPLPDIDFTKQRVVAVFMGMQRTAGYAVDIDEDVRLRSGTLEVTVRFEKPGPGAILAQVITTPYAVAVLGKGAYSRISFVDETGKVLETIDTD